MFLRPVCAKSWRSIEKVAFLGRQGTASQYHRDLCTESDGGSGAKKSQFDIATPRKAKKRQEANLKRAKGVENKDTDVHPRLVDATREVAKSLEGDKEKIAGDLLTKLNEQSKLAKKQKASQSSLSELLRQMELAEKSRSGKLRTYRNRRQQDSGDSSRSEEAIQPWRTDTDRRHAGMNQAVADHMTDSRTKERVAGKDSHQPEKGLGLFDGKGLRIFAKAVKGDILETKELSLFDKLEEKERNLQFTFPSSNAFEEEIQWTKQGKMWKFPVDNEEGMEEEQKVGFNEHVFLDQHLYDFPDKGPVRYFMDLVTLGLSKNPYLTVQQKIEHIDWYRDYFSDKLQAIEQGTESQGS